MKSLSRDLILEAAHALVAEQGMEKVNLSRVATRLGTTHAALYKYFSGKEELWTELALSWLDHQLAALFPFVPRPGSSRRDIVHDWMWTLSRTKYEVFVREPEMFKLYTTYIDQNPLVAARHVADLMGSLRAVSGIEEGRLRALLIGFSYFSAPAYAEQWLSMDFPGEFEAVWALIAPAIEP